MRPPAYAREPVGAIIAHDVDNEGLVNDVITSCVFGAQRVRGGLPRSEAAEMCWDYVKHCTQYIQETDPNMQTPRLPWRFVKDGVGDCKSQAIYIASVCAASGCKVSVRFAVLPENANDDQYGHVYAIVDGVVADPLLDFGQEVPYIRALTVPIN